jgi:maleylpyruvate isomerase
VRILTGTTFPASELLQRRLVQLVLHHTDLAAGYAVEDWPASFTELELAEPMRGQRDDRISWETGRPSDQLT